ncbi:hypothetical protein TNCV_3654361 [Trichonephila clavipes]|nr:hypothetical protein TNCV_3654361 [Trichonephila clavipes]
MRRLWFCVKGRTSNGRLADRPLCFKRRRMMRTDHSALNDVEWYAQTLNDALQTQCAVLRFISAAGDIVQSLQFTHPPHTHWASFGFGTHLLPFKTSALNVRGLRWPSGQGIGSWQACRESEPSTAKEPPCRGTMHVKSVETSNILPMVW